MTRPAEDRRRSEAIPRERVWTDEERAAFRHGLDERRSPERSNGIALRGPGGWGLQASGSHVILLVVLIAGMAGLGFVMDRGFSESAAVTRQAFSAVASSDLARQAEHRRLETASRDLVCILAIPMEERPSAVRSGDVCGWLAIGRMGGRAR